MAQPFASMAVSCYHGNMAELKSIAEIENSLVLRTDYSNEAVWQAVCAAIMDPNNEFEANVDFVSDPQYAGLKAERLQSVLPEELALSFAFIMDDVAVSVPEHPILVVDLQNEPGRTFRVVPSAVWAVENNLSIANMDFSEFAGAVDAGGVFRGF
jgi:hypothetical protein